MSQTVHKGLSHKAYEQIPGDEYDPYIKPEQKVRELTILAIIVGVIQAALFGVAMVYVGLKIGMTISASIPAAVISMLVLRQIIPFTIKLFGKNIISGTILENNIVQTIASAGGSIASGVIFTIPAAFLWQEFNPADFSLTRVFLITLIGGLLGVLMMIPLRRFLIVQEHGNLKYPEGTACAEVLVAGDIGGNPAKSVIMGGLVGGLYKFLQQGFGLWKDVVAQDLKVFKNLVFSAELTPILLGVGYIIGLEVSALMLAGGLMAWFVLIPLISYMGASLAAPVAPATSLISAMSAKEVWENYIRYIGAGAVAIGGLISLAKSLPTIWASFKSSLKGLSNTFFKKNGENAEDAELRTHKDLPLQWVLIFAVILLISIVFTRNISNDLIRGSIGAVLVFIFGFFFVTVSSRLVGLIGSSSNPVSGMTIGTLIVSCLIFKALNFHGIEGMVTALVVGAFVCIAMCTSGDVSQDLKTGFLVGATPMWQQVAMIIGVAASSFLVVWMVLFLKDQIISKEFVAPQANLMSILIRGIMEGNLPWILVFAGGFIAVCAELMGIPALPFAVGLYLPLSLSTPLIVGGILAWLTKRVFKNPVEYKQKLEKGTLISSGLIAGDAIAGLIIIVLTALNVNLPFKLFSQDIMSYLSSIQWPAVLMFGLITVFLWMTLVRKDKDDLIVQGEETAEVTPGEASTPTEES